jgi:hypothetical protein
MINHYYMLGILLILLGLILLLGLIFVNWRPVQTEKDLLEYRTHCSPPEFRAQIPKLNQGEKK